MLKINFTATFKQLKDFADSYNQQFRSSKESWKNQTNQIDDIGQMLRPNHRTLMREIVNCYAAQINEQQQVYGPIELDALPHLRINNEALASIMGCSSRSVINLLKRLYSANFLLSKRFRGSCADYEIQLNPECLYLVKNGNPAIAVQHSVQTVKRPLVNASVKKIQDKEKRNSINSIKSIGEIVENSPISQGSIEDLENVKGNMIGQKESGQNSKSNFGGTKIENRPKPSAVVEKEPPPFALAPPNAENLSPESIKYLQLLMNFAFTSVFCRLKFVTEREIQFAKSYFIDELDGLDPREAKAKFKELRIRLQLVSRWLHRDDKRYIPIPSKYLDPRNKGGFVYTMVWYQDYKDKRRKLVELNTHWKEFYQRQKALDKAVDHLLENKDYHAYKKAKKWLDDKFPEMVPAFNELAINNQRKLAS